MKVLLPKSWPSTQGRSTAPVCQSPSWRQEDSDHGMVTTFYWQYTHIFYCSQTDLCILDCPLACFSCQTCVGGVQVCAGVAVAFQANDLPNPLVELSAVNRPSHVSWTKHTLNPKFPASEAAMYDKLPSDTIITFKLFDNKGTVTKRRRRKLLGSNSVCCTHFTGEDPLYVWLPMRQPSKRHHRKHALLPPHGQVPDLQVTSHLVSSQCAMHICKPYTSINFDPDTKLVKH